jgi:hypothetical protein
MLGTKIINSSGKRFTATAVDADRFVLVPEEFGSPVAVTLVELSEDYSPADGSELPTALPLTEAETLAAADAAANDGLNARYADAVLRGGSATNADQRGFHRPPGERLPPAGSPEAFFRNLATNDEPDSAPKRRRARGTA